MPVRVGGDFLKRPRLAKNRELRLLPINNQALRITVKRIYMSEKLVVKILMIAGNIAAVVSALVVLYNLGAAIFDSDLKAYAAIDRIPIGIASFLSSVVLVGFAYIVKHVCETKD